MNNRLNFNTKYGNVFFVSDLHVRHAKDFILNPRGYKDAVEAEEHIIQEWNKIVGHDDIVFNLGDLVVGAGSESVDAAKNIIRRLNCKNHYFIDGNHMAGTKQIYRDELKNQYGLDSNQVELHPLTYEKFVFLGNYAEIVVDRQLIVLSHYAIGSWNEMGKGSWNIHGHSHGSYQNGLPDNVSTKQLDVGWDVFKRPIDFNEINKIMSKKQISRVDHH